MYSETEILNQAFSNPVVYGLTYLGYENGKPKFEKPNSYHIKRAETDLRLFDERQKAIDNLDVIACGDWVIRKDGTMERITINITDYSVQVGGGENGSFYISKSGHCSYSGSCGDSIPYEKLIKTNEKKAGSCWIFSSDYSDAGRGIYKKLLFKVWREIE